MRRQNEYPSHVNRERSERNSWECTYVVKAKRAKNNKKKSLYGVRKNKIRGVKEGREEKEDKKYLYESSKQFIKKTN